MRKIRQIIREEFHEMLNTPHHKNMLTRAQNEKINYKQELAKYKKDHEEFMDAHATVEERRDLLNRVSNGLNISHRFASDFKKHMEELLEIYSL